MANNQLSYISGNENHSLKAISLEFSDTEQVIKINFTIDTNHAAYAELSTKLQQRLELFNASLIKQPNLESYTMLLDIRQGNVGLFLELLTLYSMRDFSDLIGSEALDRLKQIHANSTPKFATSLYSLLPALEYPPVAIKRLLNMAVVEEAKDQNNLACKDIFAVKFNELQDVKKFQKSLYSLNIRDIDDPTKPRKIEIIQLDNNRLHVCYQVRLSGDEYKQTMGEESYLTLLDRLELEQARLLSLTL